MSVQREIGLFVCAVQFLTRLPTPALAGFEADWVRASARYFPLVGQIVGAISGLVFLAASQVWNGWIAAILAVAASVLVTGAFHEDGLADTADGLGGGHTAAQRLAIMKDSRLGTYGAIALVLVLALRIGALAQLPAAAGAVVLIAAHGLGRAAAVLVMAVLPYAGAPDTAKEGAPGKARPADAAIALVLAAWPLVFLPPGAVALALLAGGLLSLIVAVLARRLIGGRTGDVLGAVEQVFEVGFLLAAAA